MRFPQLNVLLSSPQFVNFNAISGCLQIVRYILEDWTVDEVARHEHRLYH